MAPAIGAALAVGLAEQTLEFQGEAALAGVSAQWGEPEEAALGALQETLARHLVHQQTKIRLIAAEKGLERERPHLVAQALAGQPIHHLKDLIAPEEVFLRQRPRSI